MGNEVLWHCVDTLQPQVGRARWDGRDRGDNNQLISIYVAVAVGTQSAAARSHPSAALTGTVPSRDIQCCFNRHGMSNQDAECHGKEPAKC